MPMSFRSLVQTLDFTVVVPDFTFTTTQLSKGVQHLKAVPCPMHWEYMKSLDCLHPVVELVVLVRRLAMTALSARSRPSSTPNISADAPHAAERTKKALIPTNIALSYATKRWDGERQSGGLGRPAKLEPTCVSLKGLSQ